MSLLKSASSPLASKCAISLGLLTLCLLFANTSFGVYQDKPRKEKQPAATAKKSKQKARASEEPIILRLGDERIGFMGIITEVHDNGDLDVIEPAFDFGREREEIGRDAKPKPKLKPGERLIGLAARSFSNLNHPKKTRLVRLSLEEILEDGMYRFKVGAECVGSLQDGDRIAAFHPAHLSDEDYLRLPDLLELTAPPADLKIPEAQRPYDRSAQSLKQVGLAMHMFHDTYLTLPPAVIMGPDGKPWHSWRVLVLPFLEEEELFKQYRFDEPWDGPNNKKLLSKIPSVYRASENDDGKGMTSILLLKGKETLFLPEGISMDAKDASPASLLAMREAGVTFRDVTDGLSTTIIGGIASADREVPWTKPDDFDLDDAMPLVGKKEGFAEFMLGNQPAALLLMGHGLVVGMSANDVGKWLKPSSTRGGDEDVDSRWIIEIPGLDPGRGNSPVIAILKSNGKQQGYWIPPLNPQADPEEGPRAEGARDSGDSSQKAASDVEEIEAELESADEPEEN